MRVPPSSLFAPTRLALPAFILALSVLAPAAVFGQAEELCSARTEQTPYQKSYGLGDLLFENDWFELYGNRRASERDECWCKNGSAAVVVLLKRDENYKVEDNEEYRQNVEKPMLRVLSARCKVQRFVRAQFFIKGHHLYRDGSVFHDREQSAGLAAKGTESAGVASLSISHVYPGAGREFFSEGSIAGSRRAKLEQEAKADSERKALIADHRLRSELEGEGVLALLDLPSSKGAPPQYDFSAHRYKSELASIYAGDFRRFTTPYESYGEEQWVADVGKGFENQRRGLGNPWQELAVRSAISTINLYYHVAYAEACKGNPGAKEIPWEEVVISYSKGAPRTYSVRKPFVTEFRKSFIMVHDLPNWVSDEYIQAVTADVRKLIADEKCVSPALRHFEVNLNLAAAWLLPLQELYKPKKTAAPSPPSRKGPDAQTRKPPTRAPRPVRKKP